MKSNSTTNVLFRVLRDLRVTFFVAAIILSAGLFSCSKKDAAPSYASALFSGSRDEADSVVAEEAAQNDSSAAPNIVMDERKLVSKASLSLRLTDFDGAEKALDELLQKYSAYTASARMYENSRWYTLKVPSPSYAPFVAGLKTLGKQLSYSESTEDVTTTYYDLESRLETQRALMKTFQSYLTKANTIDEIMTVERRIAELQSEIDRTGSRFRNLLNLVDYATVVLELEGPQSVSLSGKTTLGERFASLFRAFGDYASTVLVILTGIAVYGITSVLLLALLYWLLLGKIGLLKKLFSLASDKKTKKP
jgi:hypothetical protein